MRRPRDPEREASLLRRARDALIELENYYTSKLLRGPARSVHKSLVLLDWVRRSQ